MCVLMCHCVMCHVVVYYFIFEIEIFMGVVFRTVQHVVYKTVCLPECTSNSGVHVPILCTRA